MSFPLYIAKRYLFSKTSNNAINIITIISSFSVIVGALALFIVLSGFSGLRTFSSSLLDASDPDLKITAVKGKSFIIKDEFSEKLKNTSAIKTSSKVIEERVFLEYNDKNEIAFIKGVEPNYIEITNIKESLEIGNWLDTAYKNTAVLGRTIANKLSLGVRSFTTPLQIMVPKGGKGFLNPRNAFYKTNVQMVGMYTGTEEFESKYVFVNLQQAKNLLRFKENEISAIEIKLFKGSNVDDVADDLQNKLGENYKVQTKIQLNEVYYKMINTEHFVIYLIFTLIVIIALFNVIGSIIMMIIDKKQNLKTLFNLGASVKDIKRIFELQGYLLTFFGMLIGVIIGIIAVLLQEQYGFFMITEHLPYPVEFKFSNLCIVIITISVLGFIASKIASSRISKGFIEK